jgi:hypothetical protein
MHTPPPATNQFKQQSNIYITDNNKPNNTAEQRTAQTEQQHQTTSNNI